LRCFGLVLPGALRIGDVPCSGAAYPAPEKANSPQHPFHRKTPAPSRIAFDDESQDREALGCERGKQQQPCSRNLNLAIEYTGQAQQYPRRTRRTARGRVTNTVAILAQVCGSQRYMLQRVAGHGFPLSSGHASAPSLIPYPG
jgi:hypothetical protein